LGLCEKRLHNADGGIMKRHTGSFVAHDDKGRPYTIHIYTDFIDVSSREGSGEIEGLKELQTANGNHVNRIKQGEYQVVATGVILKSSSPDAP
jgi:hypothetical protein